MPHLVRALHDYLIHSYYCYFSLSIQDHDEIENEEKLGALDEFEDEHERLKPVSGQGKGSRGKKRADKQKSPEVMAMRRRKLWAVMSKKELAKVLKQT